LLAHVGTVERARRLYLLDLALGDLDTLHREAFDQVSANMFDELAKRDPNGAGTDEMGRRRAAAIELAPSQKVASRIAKAPRALVAALDPSEMAEDVALLTPSIPAPGIYRVGVHADGDGWRVAIAGRDQPGLLARLTSAMSTSGLSIERATIAGFSDRTVLDVFRVTSATQPDPEELATAVLNSFRSPTPVEPIKDATAAFDQHGSPWFTVCTVTATDRPGLLSSLASVMAEAGVVIHGARVGAADGRAIDRFDLSDRRGKKLDDAAIQRIQSQLGVSATT
jgi:UTP:GlnB (protein PII) uridylyltransferase